MSFLNNCSYLHMGYLDLHDVANLRVSLDIATLTFCIGFCVECPPPHTAFKTENPALQRLSEGMQHYLVLNHELLETSSSHGSHQISQSISLKNLKHPSVPLGEGSGTPLQYSCLENPMDGGPWQAAVHGVAKSRTGLSDFTFTFHFHALEKEMATHSSVLAWRIPGTGEPGGRPSLGSHRVGHE